MFQLEIAKERSNLHFSLAIRVHILILLKCRKYCLTVYIFGFKLMQHLLQT